MTATVRAPVGERQVVVVRADRVGMALDQEHLVRIARDHAHDHGGDRFQVLAWSGVTSHEPVSNVMVSMSIRRMRSRNATL